jgi:hypothetical protein
MLEDRDNKELQKEMGHPGRARKLEEKRDSRGTKLFSVTTQDRIYIFI